MDPYIPPYDVTWARKGKKEQNKHIILDKQWGLWIKNKLRDFGECRFFGIRDIRTWFGFHMALTKSLLLDTYFKKFWK